MIVSVNMKESIAYIDTLQKGEIDEQGVIIDRNMVTIVYNEQCMYMWCNPKTLEVRTVTERAVGNTKEIADVIKDILVVALEEYIAEALVCVVSGGIQKTSREGKLAFVRGAMSIIKDTPNDLRKLLMNINKYIRIVQRDPLAVNFVGSLLMLRDSLDLGDIETKIEIDKKSILIKIEDELKEYKREINKG
jgi:hypothetical protein